MTQITEQERKIIEHSLGNATHYRNHFASDPGCDQHDVIEGLCAKGLMVYGSKIPGGLIYFHVTEEGKRHAFQK